MLAPSTSSQTYPALLSPITIGRHLLRNRIVMGSMHTRLEYEADGPRKQAAFFAARARGGAALVITGGVSPNREGRIEHEAQTLERRDQLDEHRPIVEAVHAADGKILMQILHAGAYAKQDDLVNVTSVRSPINSRTPRALSSDGIERTIDDFVRCAELAIEAGYDGVEIMGSEGYFLCQCVAPHINTRTDQWGGSFENRIRLPVEIVRRTRERIGPQPIICYRISVLDLIEGAQTADEIAALACALEAAGVDMLNSGVGWHEAMVPTIAYMVPRAAFAFATRRLKAAVSIPVMASNRINMPDVAERVLMDGDADLISMARPLLADPDFARKVSEGRSDEINTCIACNQACLDNIFTERTATCLVNPRACRETELVEGKAKSPQRIAVVGSGPAGLSCAINAAERGHEVVVFESEDDIGGQLNLARAVPGKSEFNELLRYFRRHLQLNKIDVRLKTRPNAAELTRGGFHRVVVATGIKPRAPAIPGIDHPSVVSYIDILTGRVKAGARVAVIGAGGIGHDVAQFLTDPGHGPDLDDFFDAWGVNPDPTSRGGLKKPAIQVSPRQVTILQRSPGRPGDRLGKTTGWVHRIELRRRGVTALSACSYVKIDDHGLHILINGEPKVLAVDTIVICAGQEPDQDLARDLQAAGVPVDLIGGARVASELDAFRAIDEGLRLAYTI